MSCSCSDPSDFQCVGPQAAILANPALSWILTTTPLLGTTPEEADVPNGPLNQLFWKLLQNDCAIATFIHNAFSRTYGVFDGAAPAVNTIPSPMPGAPAEPTLGAVHTVIFDNFEVTYRWSGTAWVEVARLGRTQQVAAIYTKKVIIPLGENDTEVAFSVPTETDDEIEFPFTIDDLALIYVNNADTDMPFVGVVPGINLSGAVVRIALSSPITEDSNYELVALFRRTTLN